MKLIKNILFYIVMVVSMTIVNAQPNWSVQSTNSHATVKIPGQLILPATVTGDVYVGAFYYRAGEFRCGGFGEFESGSDLYFPIYKLDGQTDGFIEGEKIDILIYNEGQGCQHFYNVSFGSGVNIFSESDTFEVVNATPSATVNVNYGTTSRCQSEGIIVPNIYIPYLPGGSIGLEFDASDDLVMNSVTGEILPGQSRAGNYLINIESDYCLTQNTFAIEIREFPMDEITTKDVSICDGATFEVEASQLNGDLLLTPVSPTVGYSLSNAGVNYYQLDYLPTGCPGFTAYNVTTISNAIPGIEYEVTPKTCFKDGSIQVDESTLTSISVEYYLLDGDSSKLASIDNLEVGIHTLEVKDDIGCIHTISDNIEIESDLTKCQKEDIVFYPDHQQFSNGRIYLDQEGSIKVIGKNGELINEFVGPLEWDGKDINGNGLKSGIYFIIYEGNIIQNLTIVR